MNSSASFHLFGWRPSRGVARRPHSRLARSALGIVLAPLLLGGCAAHSVQPAAGSITGSIAGSITVFAASSLKGAFATIGAQFEAAHPGVKVIFNFGPSSGLATQIAQGAPADVFAAASAKTMDTVISAGEASAASTFAANSMEIATPAHPTRSVTSLADLAGAAIKVAICQQDVPCGAAALTLFSQNRIRVTPVTQELDVKAVLTKVQLGEVDAGIVYVTDVKAAKGAVIGIQIPAADNVTTTYPIAPITNSTNGSTAQAFVDYVLSDAGKNVLRAAGFLSP